MEPMIHGDALNRTSGRRLLLASVAFFFLVKLWWVLAPMGVMGQPRLGDDALVYLWRGAGTLLHPKSDTEAVRDIVSLRRLADAPSARQDFLRANTTMRTGGVSVSPWAMVTGALLDAGISQKWTFAVTETVTVIVLTAGIACFLSTLVGKSAAGIGMVLLAFAIFPNHGMHYLNPSVLNFGLALLLWTLILRQSNRLWIVALLTATIPLVHPIGFVFAAIGLAMASHIALLKGGWRIAYALPLTLLLSAFVALAVRFVPGVQAPPTTGMGGFVPSAIPENLVATFSLIWRSVRDQPAFWILAGAGMVFVSPTRSAIASGRVVLTWVLLSLAASTAFNLPGYPAELSSRVLVWGAVCLSGFAGLWVARLHGLGGTRAILAPVIVCVCVLSQVPTYLRAFFANANGRYLLYDEGGIERDLSALPAGSGVLWLNSDTLMMAALLKGAWRFSAIPFQMVTGSSRLTRILEAEWTGIVAAAPPESLNSRAAWGSWTLGKRFYGYSFLDVSRIDLTLEQRSFEAVYLLLSEDAKDLQVTATAAGQPCPAPTTSLLPAGADQWLVVDVRACQAADQVIVQAPESDLRVKGLQLSSPRPRVLWPWGESGLLLLARPRDPDRKVLGVDFSWNRIFKDANAAELLDEAVIQPQQLLADQSGIIWFDASMRSARNVP